MHYVDKICKLFLLLVLFRVDLSAQTATTVSGYPVIDLSALNPLGAVLSSAEASSRRTLMNQQTPSNTAYLGVGSSVSGYNGTWNAKMSPRYQVMRSNISSGTDWANAWTLCRNYSGEGGSAGAWRLPTTRELQMIWVLQPQLMGKGSFNALTSSGYYWTGSEGSGTTAGDMSFSSGGTWTGDSKTSSYQVRCIRDI